MLRESGAVAVKHCVNAGARRVSRAWLESAFPRAALSLEADEDQAPERLVARHVHARERGAELFAVAVDVSDQGHRQAEG